MFDANNQLRSKHPFYRLFLMNEQEVFEVLKNWSREEVIAWLKWNDPHGSYEDEESVARFGAILNREEGVGIIIRQIFHNSDDHDPAKGSVREPDLLSWMRL